MWPNCMWISIGGLENFHWQNHIKKFYSSNNVYEMADDILENAVYLKNDSSDDKDTVIKDSCEKYEWQFS